MENGKWKMEKAAEAESEDGKWKMEDGKTKRSLVNAFGVRGIAGAGLVVG